MIFCLGNWKSVEGERMEITDGIGLAKFGEIGKLLLIVVLVKFILYGCLTFRNGCIEKIARYQTVVAVFVGISMVQLSSTQTVRCTGSILS